MNNKIKKEMNKMVKKELKYSHITNVLIIVLLILFVINSVTIFSANKNLKNKISEMKEASRPAEISVTILTGDCEDCLNTEGILANIKKTSNVISEDKFGFEESKELISKYSIERLPSVIITGELDRLNLGQLSELFTKSGDARILTNIPAPYVDAKSGKIKGLVTITYIKDSSCKECIDLEPFFAQFGQAGIRIKDTKTIEFSSEEGKSLAARYNIQTVPLLIFSEGLSEYPSIMQGWDQIGTEESDGMFIMRKVIPPYKDLKTDSIKGIVDVIYLTDKSCEKCYDVNIHKNILASVGIKPSKEEILDVSSEKGKSIVGKYKITKVPTIVMSSGAGEYQGIASAWKEVGDIASDGSYVFRGLDLMGVPYKDLSANQFVEPKASEQGVAQQ